MAKTSQTKAFIRKGEIFFLNGALIRAQDSFSMEIMLADTLLLPSQIVSDETAKSHLQKAYYYAQQMIIEPIRKGDWQKRLEGCVVELPLAAQEKIRIAYQGDNLQKVLTVIRAELKKGVASTN